MLAGLGHWFGGGADGEQAEEDEETEEAARAPGSPGASDEWRLREISLEYEEAALQEATRNFHDSRLLGSGNYGCVYRGTLPDGHDVAIKVLDIEGGSKIACGFADEVRVLSKFRHPNLVTLMGWGVGRPHGGKSRRFLVYELMSGGDVSQRLAACRSDGGRAFVWSERLWIALDACCGLSHMLNSSPKAFHRDIKSANILLDRSGTAKMADFGLSGIAQHKDKMNMTCEQIAGTPGYACPHYIKTGRVTEQTEVYAFGMVMLELLLNSMPACLGQGGNIFYPIFQAVRPLEPGALDRALATVDARAMWLPELAREVGILALRCSDIELSTRPLFNEVGRELRRFCEQYCQGQRGAPSTDPKLRQPSWHPGGSGGGGGGDATYAAHGLSALSPTRPQLPGDAFGGGIAAPGATRPQLQGGGASSWGGAGNSTRPQLACGAMGNPTRPQLGAAGLGNATRPQLGGGSGAALGLVGNATRPQLAGMAAGNPTRPQLGAGAAGNPTRPQLGGAGLGGASFGGPSGNPTRPQLGAGAAGNPTMPQLGGASGNPTRPQLGAGAGAAALGNPTRPQLSGGYGGNSTRPQLGGAAGGAFPGGLGGAFPGGLGGAGTATRPQLGAGPVNPTCPQMAGGFAGALAAQAPCGGGFEPPTRPQMGMSGYPGAPPVTCPQMGPGTGADGPPPPPAFEEVVAELRRGGWTAATEGQTVDAGEADVILECILAKGVDLATLPLSHRCLALCANPGPCPIGRLQQPNLFARLVPEEALRASISRSHLQLSRRYGAALLLKRLSGQALLVDGRPIPPQQELPVSDGGQIGLCLQDSLTTFLAFRVLLRHGAPAPARAAAAAAAVGCRAVPPSPPPAATGAGVDPSAGPSPGGWWFTGSAEYRLVCVFAYGRDVERLPPESRTFGLKPGAAMSVGRLHQPGFFEGLLGEESGQRYLCCVSRQHVELRPLGDTSRGRGERQPLLEVRNISSNPVQLAAAGSAPRKLEHGAAGELAVEGLVEFLGEAPDGSGATVTYLRLRLERRPEGRSGDEGLAAGYPPPPPTEAVLSVAAPAANSPMGGPPFWLMLGGSAVRRDYPEERRRLEGQEAGLTVGRAYQQALHTSAFDTALRQYLSRDHFRVEHSRDGWQLAALSSNPIWRRSRGKLVEATAGGRPLWLSDGDDIVLFTGADDCTPDGPGNLGSLHWVFHEGGGATAGRPAPRPRSKSPRRAYFGDSTALG